MTNLKYLYYYVYLITNLSDCKSTKFSKFSNFHYLCNVLIPITLAFKIRSFLILVNTILACHFLPDY